MEYCLICSMAFISLAYVKHNLSPSSKTSQWAVVMGFAKAFDKVLYQCLLSKCHHYSIQGTTFDWVSNFLHGWSQTVVLDGESSASATVTSGIPQGFVLGPILFLCYTNDLTEQISSFCRIFTDDSVLYREIKKPENPKTFQDDLTTLEAWKKHWEMEYPHSWPSTASSQPCDLPSGRKLQRPLLEPVCQQN